jgi:hypothetical protein
MSKKQFFLTRKCCKYQITQNPQLSIDSEFSLFYSSASDGFKLNFSLSIQNKNCAMTSSRLLLILLVLSELSDFRSEAVEESDVSEGAIIIDDTMTKLNHSAFEPDAEIIMTNVTEERSIKRKSECLAVSLSY